MSPHLPVLDRRALLFLGGAAALGAVAVGCSSSKGNSAKPAKLAEGVTLSTATFHSAARSVGVTYQVILPPGHATLAGLPVCLVLHGRGDNHEAAVKLVHLDRALASVVGAGAPPFALVAMDGGDHTYWHKRADGDDPQTMLLAELLPRLEASGAKTARFGLCGWSMGAYGSLLLAEKVGRQRAAFVAADSPALWLSPGLSAPGAFDDAEDFVRNDVFASRARLAGVPVRVMCGRADTFLGATQEFVKGVPDLLAADYPPGGHTPSLWAATAVAQLTPLAHALG